MTSKTLPGHPWRDSDFLRPTSPAPKRRRKTVQQIYQDQDFLSWPEEERAEFLKKFQSVFERTPVFLNNKHALMSHLAHLTGALLR